jgi:sulfur carrier protein ThiS
MIRLEVDSKLPGRAATRTVEAAPGLTVEELLGLLGLAELAGEIIVVYQGASVTLADRLPANGRVVLLPVICGG